MQKHGGGMQRWAVQQAASTLGGMRSQRSACARGRTCDALRQPAARVHRRLQAAAALQEAALLKGQLRAGNAGTAALRGGACSAGLSRARTGTDGFGSCRGRMPHAPRICGSQAEAGCRRSCSDRAACLLPPSPFRTCAPQYSNHPQSAACAQAAAHTSAAGSGPGGCSAAGSPCSAMLGASTASPPAARPESLLLGILV